jgi:response regulator RpfG family c-di-GMP phosphodiesterase
MSTSILLVDSSRGAVAYQETILRRREANVLTALAGSDGLQRARESQPQLIIFGFDLFDMLAPEFCREVRANDAIKSTSLLLVCERDSGHDDLCLSAGCNDVVYRPLHRDQLDAKVTRLTTIPARRQLRTITRLEVSVEKNGRFVLARSVNISATGMLIEADRVLPGEGSLRVHFYLPGDPKPLMLAAEVLRAEFAGTTAKYGVRFDADAEQRERIERYVNRIRSRELI